MFLLVAIQISFVQTLPLWLAGLNLVLVVTFFILSLKSLVWGLWWAVGSGFFLDLFSFAPIGVNIISLFLAMLAVNFLLNNFFTDRSLYAFLALIIFATISYEVLKYFILYFISLGNENLHLSSLIVISKQEVWQLILNLLLTVILFNSINFMSRKLRPMFLFPNK